MSAIARTTSGAIFGWLLITASLAGASWNQNGTPVSTSTGTQERPAVIDDGAGGLITVWMDSRSGNYDIYAQRTNAAGGGQWVSGGTAICVATGTQDRPVMTPDGAGGAIIAWHDGRSGGVYDIYAQRVNAAGAVLWATGGVQLCGAAGNQDAPFIVPDGFGGAIVMWMDHRNAYNEIYAQRINATGAIQWPVNGVAICSGAEYRENPAIAGDGAGGALVAWTAGGTSDLRIQRVSAGGVIQWVANGIALSADNYYQTYPAMVSDGAGGAIIVWQDNGYNSGADYDIRAQRVTAAGVLSWGGAGVILSAAFYEQMLPVVVADGAGGAIVAWRDSRSLANYDVYAQRVDVAGVVRWTPDGVALCTATGHQVQAAIRADGAGGAIVAWSDARTGDYDIYAQRVYASGQIGWAANGLALCTATGTQDWPAVTTDGAGGAIVAWQDHRAGLNQDDIYAQQADQWGRVGYRPPVISSIRDVPADQGGRVRIAIDRCPYDNAIDSTPVASYNIWQRIDNQALKSVLGSTAIDAHELFALGTGLPGAKYDKANGPLVVRGVGATGAEAFPVGTWELVGSFAACQQDQYLYRASTLADSTAAGTPFAVHVVSAHTTAPATWFVSEPDSGYSVDNIAPAIPAGLHRDPGNVLVWQASPDADFQYFTVYGSAVDHLTGGETLVAQTVGTSADIAGLTFAYFLVAATDYHGNQGDAAVLDALSDVPNAPPASLRLHPCRPNPFNPRTTIRFDLPGDGLVRLCVFDVAGRLVRTLVDDSMPRGSHEAVWDGRDASGREVGSGTYLARLEFGGKVETVRMVLIQ